MHPDIQRLIALQNIDSAVHDAERRIAAEPDHQKSFEARLEVVRQQVAHAREQLTDNQNVRRGIEKDVAVHQGRLSKFRDQLMAVKTNIEYQAMQKEIGFAQGEVKTLEDRILELMMQADDITADVKRAEAALAAEQKAVDKERQTLAAEIAELTARQVQLTKERAEVVASLDPKVLAVFEMVSRRRNGVAVAEARDGICTICHVRLRPQVFNTVRRNEDIVQCDTCQRILYFVATAAPAAENAAQPAHGV
jgi:hypothetical protein